MQNEEKKKCSGKKGTKHRPAYKERSIDEKFRYLCKLIEELSNYLDVHDVETEAGESFSYGKQLEIAMLFDDPCPSLKEEWVSDFDEGGLPLLRSLFFHFCSFASEEHRLLIASLKKDGFKKGDRVKVPSFELFGPKETKVVIPAGRVGTFMDVEPGEFCTIAEVVLDDFSYEGYDFDGLEVWMRLDQLEKADEEKA